MAGKGDNSRVTNHEQYRENYDHIFAPKNKRKEEDVEELQNELKRLKELYKDTQDLKNETKLHDAGQDQTQNS